MCAIIIGLLNKDFSIVAKSSHHVSERHITLKKEIIESKTSGGFFNGILGLLLLSMIWMEFGMGDMDGCR